ncbi:PREDICTED: uncharacterized protein LOC107334017 [Acropora digitifera]|uniref:uncharacterized protein LOC107334017 n=1 Tax=Acropora digitifera TaxID=70779 RepID=UPI00077AADD8|nr:PREDICTED: uncharacterized protein LOC107334017 [Acropora digitifera]
MRSTCILFYWLIIVFLAESFEVEDESINDEEDYAVRRHFFRKKCLTDDDCKENECCGPTYFRKRLCYRQRRLGEWCLRSQVRCSPVSCQDGLDCQPVALEGGRPNWFRWRKCVPSEPSSGDFSES